MSFGFYFPFKLILLSSWIPEFGPDFSSSDKIDFPDQVKAESSGGVVYTQEKGNMVREFNLVFSLMKESDVNSLRVFFSEKAEKSMNSFEYEDGNGVLHNVTWINEFQFRKTSPGLYTGVIILRREQ